MTMKISLNEKGTEVTITGAFCLAGVPTGQAQKDAEAGIDNPSLNHASTGGRAPVATGHKFKGLDGKEREMFIGLNITSRPTNDGKRAARF
jgi:hypothetical protein